MPREQQPDGVRRAALRIQRRTSGINRACLASHAARGRACRYAASGSGQAAKYELAPFFLFPREINRLVQVVVLAAATAVIFLHAEHRADPGHWNSECARSSLNFFILPSRRLPA